MASKIQVDSIGGEDPTDSPTTFPQGITVPSGFAINSSSGMVVNGTLTATTLIGDGTQLTGVEFATISKTIAFSLLAA